MEPGWPFGGRPKARKPWSLWKAGRLMECEINEVRDSSRDLLGVEVRVYVAGDFHYSRVHPSAESADAEALKLRRDSIAAGWTDRPPMPT